MSRTKTHDEYVNELKLINLNIEVLTQYINAKVKILVKCLIDDHEWYSKPFDLLNGHGCPECKRKTLSKLKTKNHEDFVNQLNTINPNIIVLSKYKGCNKKVKCKCKIDGYEWSVTPTYLLSGVGCRMCWINSLIKTNDEFLNELKETNKKIIPLEEYKGSNIKIKFKCLIDNNEWYAKPNSILMGQSCPECGNRSRNIKLRKTQQEFVKEMKLLNDNIEILGKYINNKTHLLCKCKIDNTEWMAIPNGLLRGTGCPTCNGSRGENKIRMFLINNNIDFIYQKKFEGLLGTSGGQLSYDFLVGNVLIEYQGQFHDGTAYQSTKESFKIQQENDRLKKEYAKNNNYELLEIWYWDYDNTPNILTTKLKLN